MIFANCSNHWVKLNETHLPDDVQTLDHCGDEFIKF